MDRHIVFSGIQPSGKLHIGNYLGAVKQWLPLQDQHPSFFCIVDLHALTVPQDPKRFREQVIDAAIDYLALGLDPDKATIYVQSHVSEHVELMWLLNTLTHFGELRRMTQWKSKVDYVELLKKKVKQHMEESKLAEKQMIQLIDQAKEKTRPSLTSGIPGYNIDLALDELVRSAFADAETNEYKELFIQLMHESETEILSSVKAGLLNYPILMAADILLYKASLVPVGEEQSQHVELTRTLAKKFNARFGETFPLPQVKLNAAKRIMSLVDPTVKMSKSGGPASFLALADEPDVVRKKLAKAVTATEGGKANPGVANLFAIFREVGDPAVVQRFEEQERDGTIRYVEFKTALADAINDHLADYRATRADLAEKPRRVQEILHEGAKRARKVAAATMAQVREKVGLTTP